MTEQELGALTLEELTKLKADVSASIKSKKEEEKGRKVLEREKKVQWAQENLKVGDVVIFTYKEEELEGGVVKLTDKGFTVAFEYEGEDKVLSRQFHLLVNRVNEEEEVA